MNELSRSTSTEDRIEELRREFGGSEAAVPRSALKKAREVRGLSQGALAASTGVDQSAISKIENGQLRLSTKHAAALAPALGVSPAELGIAEGLAALKRAAGAGTLDPQDVLGVALKAAETGDTPRSQEVVGGLLDVLTESMSAFEVEFPPAAEQTRDHLGRRINKPYDPKAAGRAAIKSRPEQERVERDVTGRRTNKPSRR